MAQPLIYCGRCQARCAIVFFVTSLPGWRNWQTRRSQKPLPRGVWVRVPLRAPMSSKAPATGPFLVRGRCGDSNPQGASVRWTLTKPSVLARPALWRTLSGEASRKACTMADACGRSARRGAVERRRRRRVCLGFIRQASHGAKWPRRALSYEAGLPHNRPFVRGTSYDRPPTGQNGPEGPSRMKPGLRLAGLLPGGLHTTAA